ncbi:MAG TPA: carotenoid oxygenase family protein [Streptosporangiaceae bacterium]|jgi:carotenoid cleavage dioxygenase-like enzyme
MPDHRLGFQTLDHELEPTLLKVEGALPTWLTGALLRTGPARFEVGGRNYQHWFDGLAMLHRFAFADGTASYTNRFIQSNAYQAARDSDQISYSEFATDPCRSLFKRIATAFHPPSFGNNANVSIVRQGDEFLALTETPLPVRFDPETLETLGVAQPAPGQMTVAHPHRAPETGEYISYATHFGPFTTYRVFGQDGRTGRRRMITKMPVRTPSYMHSFAITRRYMVLVEFPFTVIPVMIPLSGRPLIENYRWQPRRGTKFHIIDLSTGDVRATGHGPALFAFHHVNAFERDGEIVIDLCGYDDASIIGALYLDNLRTAEYTLPGAMLHRYRLPLRGGDVVREPLPEAQVELPRIDYSRRNGKPYRYVYGVGGLADRITKADLEQGVVHWSEPGVYPGEPVFVRTPGTVREDDGVLLSVVLDAEQGTSFLLVLDATDLSEIARCRVPQHIPFGFHGNYFR